MRLGDIAPDDSLMTSRRAECVGSSFHTSNAIDEFAGEIDDAVHLDQATMGGSMQRDGFSGRRDVAAETNPVPPFEARNAGGWGLMSRFRVYFNTEAEEYQTVLSRDDAVGSMMQAAAGVAEALGRTTVTPKYLAGLPDHGFAYVLAAALMWLVVDRPDDRFVMQEHRDDETSAAIVQNRAISGIRVRVLPDDEAAQDEDDDSGPDAPDEPGDHEQHQFPLLSVPKELKH